jgi:sugar lactone lactonase YvrE
VASVRFGTIAEVGPDGSSRELLQRHRSGISAVLGVRVDPRRRVLWATTSGIPQTEGYQTGDSAIAALLEIRPSDGAVLRRWDLPPAPHGHVLGDLAVGDDGTVYFTDSVHPYLYRLRSPQDTVERMTHGLFRSLQGMAPAADGRSLIVADYSHGLLLVDFAAGTVRPLDGDLQAASRGCDGIALAGNALIAVQNGVSPARIVRFDLDATHTRITGAALVARDSAQITEPTIGAVVEHRFVFAANSQWDEYTDAGVRKAGPPLAAPRLLAVSIDP